VTGNVAYIRKDNSASQQGRLFPFTRQ
jgi:hypothetical protein